MENAWPLAAGNRTVDPAGQNASLKSPPRTHASAIREHRRRRANGISHHNVQFLENPRCTPVDKSRARTVLRIDRRQQSIYQRLCRTKWAKKKNVQRDGDHPKGAETKGGAFSFPFFPFPAITLPVEEEAGHRAVAQRSRRVEVRSGYLPQARSR